jgi:hypothetical protein
MSSDTIPDQIADTISYPDWLRWRIADLRRQGRLRPRSPRQLAKRAYDARYYREHREQKAAYVARYYLAHKAERDAYIWQWKAEHPLRVSLYAARYAVKMSRCALLAMDAEWATALRHLHMSTEERSAWLGRYGIPSECTQLVEGR